MATEENIFKLLEKFANGETDGEVKNNPRSQLERLISFLSGVSTLEPGKWWL